MIKAVSSAKMLVLKIEVCFNATDILGDNLITA